MARILLKRIKNALQVTVAAMISLTGSAKKTAKTLSCKIRGRIRISGEATLIAVSEIAAAL